MKPTKSNTPYYQTGLGPAFLARARLIFGIFFVLTLLAFGTTAYAGVKNGAINKYIVNPIKQTAGLVTKGIEEASKESTNSGSHNTVIINNGTSENGENTVIINGKVVSSTKPLATVKPVTTTIRPRAVVPVATPKPECIEKNIREGEFASDKCYTQKDYADLNYYLNAYSSALSDKSFYATKEPIDCSNTNFFGQENCDEAKRKKAEAEANVPKYRSIIQTIIARGTAI